MQIFIVEHDFPCCQNQPEPPGTTHTIVSRRSSHRYSNFAKIGIA